MQRNELVWLDILGEVFYVIWGVRFFLTVIAFWNTLSEDAMNLDTITTFMICLDNNYNQEGMESYRTHVD